MEYDRHATGAVVAGFPDAAAWILTAALGRNNLTICSYSETNVCDCIRACHLSVAKVAEGLSPVAGFKRILLGRESRGTSM